MKKFYSSDTNISCLFQRWSTEVCIVQQLKDGTSDLVSVALFGDEHLFSFLFQHWCTRLLTEFWSTTGTKQALAPEVEPFTLCCCVSQFVTQTSDLTKSLKYIFVFR